jgi:hypothetical protein
MTAKRAGVRLADSSEFSRGVLTLHHGSGRQASCKTPWWRTPNMAAPAELGSRYCMRRSLVFSSRATRKFYTLSPVLHGRAVQTASLELLSISLLPSKGHQLATFRHLSGFIYAAMKCSCEKQATGRRIDSRPPTSERAAPAPRPRTSSV